MSMFDKAFDRVIGHEGGFQDQPTDRGNWTSGVINKGELKGTKFGISAASYPTLDIKNLTVEQAKAIYKRDFWDKLGMERFNPAMQYQLFDAAINHGWGNTSKILQRAVGVKDDGIIGPATLAKVAAMELNDLLLNFVASRMDFFLAVPTFTTYGRGWMARCATNLRYATQDN